MQKILLVVLLLLTGCSYLPRLSPHKIDIQQGNFIDQDAVAKLKPGMSKSQVRFLLGTPLVADPFHADRWDYVYRVQKGESVPEQRRVTAIFANDRLLRLEGNVTISAAFADPQAAIEAAGEREALPGGAAPATLAPLPPGGAPASPAASAPASPQAAAPASSAAAKPQVGFTPPGSSAPASQPSAPTGAAAPSQATRSGSPAPAVAAGAAAGAVAAGAAKPSNGGAAAAPSATSGPPQTPVARSTQSSPQLTASAARPPAQTGGSFTDSIKKGFGFDVSTPPPAPPRAARPAPASGASTAAATADGSASRPPRDPSAVPRPSSGSGEVAARPAEADAAVSRSASMPSGAPPSSEASSEPVRETATVAAGAPAAARTAPPPVPAESSGGVTNALKRGVGMDVDSAPPVPPGRVARSAPAGTPAQGRAADSATGTQAQDPAANGAPAATGTAAESATGATAKAATGTAAEAAAGSAASSATSTASGSSGGMLSGIYRGVKGVLGVEDDVAAAPANPSTGGARSTPREAAVPRPQRVQPDRLARPRAQEDRVERPDAGVKGSSKAAASKQPVPAKSESIGTQVVDSVENVLGLGGGSGGQAVPRPQ